MTSNISKVILIKSIGSELDYEEPLHIINVTAQIHC